MGPVQAEKYATDELTWAQHWPQSMQLTILHGPNPGHPACYQWSCVGPALATKHATNGLAWAQSRPKSMLPMNSHGPSPGHPASYPMVLCGPSTGHKACNRWSCMGPEQAEKYATNELAWAQHWPQSMQPTI